MNLVAWGLWFHFWLGLLTLWAGILVIFWSYVDRDSPMIHRACRWWGRNLLKIAHIPVQVEGLEHLVPGQAYVFAANHRSNFDIFALISVLPGRFLWVAKKSLFQIPVLGQALSRMGSISVDRDNLRSAVQSLDRATALVKRGVSLIIFPEGTRATVPGALALQERGVHHGHQGRAAHRAGEHQRHPLHPAPGDHPDETGADKGGHLSPHRARAPSAAKRTSWPQCARPSTPTTTPTFPYGPGNPELA